MNIFFTTQLFHALRRALRIAFRSASVLFGLWIWTSTAQADTDLMSMSLEELLDVKVVGASKYEQHQREIAAAVSVITRQEIKAFGWRTVNEALSSLPGVHTTYDRQYHYLGTRGLGLPGDLNTRLLVTINGNRVNDALFDSSMLGRQLPLDMDLIERIEYIPGPGGAVYGQNALFAVINIVTRNGAALSGIEETAGYQYPSNESEGRISWGQVLDNGIDVLLSVSAYNAKGEDHYYDFGDASVAGLAQDMDGEKDKEFFVRLAHGAWYFDTSYGDRRKDDPTAAWGGDPLAPGQYERDKNLLTQLQYQQGFFDDKLHLSNRVFLGQHRYTALFFYGGAGGLSQGPSNYHGAEARLLVTALAQHKFMLGVEYQNNNRQDQTWDDITTDGLDSSIPKSGHRFGAYVQDEWAPLDALRTTIGLRVDKNNVTGSNLSPRAGFIWNLTTHTTWKFLYGRAHRAPNAYEKDYDDGGVTLIANPALDGETIDTLEWTQDYRPSNNMSLRSSIYHWKLQQLITQVVVDEINNISQFQNGQDINATGAELSMDKTWPWEGRLRSSVSYQKVTYKNDLLLENSPKWLGKINFSSPLPLQLHLGAEAQYNSSRRTLGGDALRGYWLANLNLVADQWIENLELSLNIRNLFNTAYTHPGSVNNWQDALEQDGRSIGVLLNYRFNFK